MAVDSCAAHVLYRRTGVHFAGTCASLAAITGILWGLTSLAAQAQTTVTMWSFLNPAKNEGREVALRRIIEAFEKSNPDIKVKVEPQLWSTLTQKFVLGNSSGDAPDISWVQGQDSGLVAEADAVADLNGLIFAKWSPEQRKDLAFAKAYEYTSYGGKQLGVPIVPYAVGLFYRKDMFAQAGLTVDAIRTWDGFVDSARKLTKDLDGDGRPDIWGMAVPLSQDRATSTPAATGFIQARGNILDNKCKAAFANPDGVKSLQMQADLITKHKVVSPEDLSRNNDDAFDQFVAGRAAIVGQSFARFSTIQTLVAWDKTALGLAPWPSWTADKAGPAIASAWYATIWRKSPRTKEAARFVEYMIGPQASAIWTETGDLLPLRHSVAALPQFASAKYAHLKDSMKIMEETGVFTPAGCNVTRTLGDFNVATQRVVLGNVSPMDALAEAEKASNRRQ